MPVRSKSAFLSRGTLAHRQAAACHRRPRIRPMIPPQLFRRLGVFCIEMTWLHLRARVFMASLALIALSVLTAGALATSGMTQQGTIHFARCPHVAKAEGAEAKTDHNPRAAETTVPMPPSALQLCRYNRFGAGLARRLSRERIIANVASIRSVAREFNSLGEFPEEPTSCPADEGARLYAVFAYADPAEPKVPVEIRLSGCPYAWNGRTEHAYWTSSSLYHRLDAMTIGKR